MSTPHTEGRVTFREDGDANHWSMLAVDGRWLLALLHNGEAPSERQVANFLRLVACWNACDGIDTYALELMTGDLSIKNQITATGKARTKPTHRAVEYRRQRDELLAALEQIERLGREADGNLVDVRAMLGDIARAAISTVKPETT